MAIEDAVNREVEEESALNKQGIDANIMAEYLTSVGAGSDCEVCQAHSWTVTANVGSASPVITAVDLSKPSDTLSLPVVILSCNNCGNTKLFGRDFIGRWLERRDKAK